MKKLKGEAKRKAWEEGWCLGFGEKGHMIAICSKVRYAERALNHLNRALPVKEEKGKPKRHLQVSATNQEGSKEDSGPS